MQATFEAASKAQVASFAAASKTQAERLARLEDAVNRLSAPAPANLGETSTELVVLSPQRHVFLSSTPPRQPSTSNSGRGFTKKKRVYSPPANNKFAALADNSDDEDLSSPVVSMADLSCADSDEYKTGQESMVEDDDSVVSELSILLETQSPESHESIVEICTAVHNLPSNGSNVVGMPK